MPAVVAVEVSSILFMFTHVDYSVSHGLSGTAGVGPWGHMSPSSPPPTDLLLSEWPLGALQTLLTLNRHQFIDQLTAP